MTTFKHRLGAFSIVVIAAVGLSACMSETEPPEEANGEDGTIPGDAPERAGEDTAEAQSAAYYCSPGYHGHFVDWDATRIVPWGACDSSNGLVHYGHPICMLDGTQGYSCNGYWWVYAYSPANGLYGAIKIAALNGH